MATPTNDSFVLIATHKAGNARSSLSCAEGEQLKAALLEVALKSSRRLIVRDGEGATKFISVKVEGGKNGEEAVWLLQSTCPLALVKTAFCFLTPIQCTWLRCIGAIADLVQTKIDSVNSWTMRAWWSTAAAILPTRKKTVSA